MSELISTPQRGNAVRATSFRASLCAQSHGSQPGSALAARDAVQPARGVGIDDFGTRQDHRRRLPLGKKQRYQDE